MLLLKVFCHSSQCSDPSVKLSAMHMIGTYHASFLIAIISDGATDATSYTILTVDFMMNMILCFKIIKRYKQNNNQVDEGQLNDIQELVLNESIEITLPIGYCLCFSLVYYGPNSALFNVGGRANIEKIITITIQFFSIDLCSVIFSSILLWKLCGINLYKAFLHTQKELWIIMSSQEAFVLYWVRYFIIYFVNLFNA